MRIHLIAVGTQMPPWVEAACEEYRKRMPRHCALCLRSVSAARRTKGADLKRAREQEGERLLAAVPGDCHLIALERGGRVRDSVQLASLIRELMREGRDLAFLIGGPEGLAPACLARARETWSLSAFTLAHPVARVVLAEQLYRAWSIIDGLPYHR